MPDRVQPMTGLFGPVQDTEEVITSLLAIKEPTKPTNTIIATNLPSSIFTGSELQAYRSSVDEIAPTRAWIPLKSFTRVVMSFTTEREAAEVRATIDKQLLRGSMTHVFYGQAMASEAHGKNSRLEVPALEKNWLISPPGSPPVGWTQVREDAPNAQTLHEDLISALQALSQEINTLSSSNAVDEAAMHEVDGEDPSEHEITVLQDQSETLPGIVVHLDPSDSTGVALQNGVNGIERTKVQMVKTPMPGHNI